MEKSEQEWRMQGSPVCDGIALGSLFFLHELDEGCESFSLESSASAEKVDDEVNRFKQAVFSSRSDLEALRKKVKGSSDQAESVIGTHIAMLHDPMITHEVESRLRSQKVATAGNVFRSVIREYESRFNKLQSSFFKDRFIDVYDVSKRILSHLEERALSDISKAPQGSIVITQTLTPSDAAAADPDCIYAFVAATCGTHSHAALIARSKGIPIIAGIFPEQLEMEEGQYCILDGKHGDLILNPSDATLDKYIRLRDLQRETPSRKIGEMCHSADGTEIDLSGNVGSLADVEVAAQCGIRSIGLFRTEFLYFEDPSILGDEEKQFVCYKTSLEKMGSAPVTFRAFDFGGDKPLPGDLSPSLKGTAFLLDREEILRVQLRALLRAASFGNARLMLPFVAHRSELIQVRALITDECRILKISPDILELGTMIEIPECIEKMNELALESDFFSIGTNDLLYQYYGLNRGEAEVSELIYACDPGYLRLLCRILEKAAKLNKAVHICGEIAAEPLILPLLLGLGVRAFSASSRHFSIIRQALSPFSITEAEELARTALQCKDGSEVIELLVEVHRTKGLCESLLQYESALT